MEDAAGMMDLLMTMQTLKLFSLQIDLAPYETTIRILRTLEKYAGLPGSGRHEMICSDIDQYDAMYLLISIEFTAALSTTIDIRGPPDIDFILRIYGHFLTKLTVLNSEEIVLSEIDRMCPHLTWLEVEDIHDETGSLSNGRFLHLTHLKFRLNPTEDQNQSSRQISMITSLFPQLHSLSIQLRSTSVMFPNEEKEHTIVLPSLHLKHLNISLSSFGESHPHLIVIEENKQGITLKAMYTQVDDVFHENHEQLDKMIEEIPRPLIIFKLASAEKCSVSLCGTF